MSVMDDMLAWLDETLTHVERTAQAVIETAEWAARGNEVVEVFGAAGPPDQVCRATDRTDAEHIALHDPRAVLARIAAERAILAEHADQHECTDGIASTQWPTEPCRTMRLLAWGHRYDAPGFLEEWAPHNAKATT